jgi:hypothetical protein
MLPDQDQPAKKERKGAPFKGDRGAALCALRSASQRRLEERAACDGT